MNDSKKLPVKVTSGQEVLGPDQRDSLVARGLAAVKQSLPVSQQNLPVRNEETETLIEEYLDKAWRYTSCLVSDDEDDDADLDMEEGVKWFLKAAELGSIEAQLELARAYSLGDGVEIDFAEAVNWSRKAADQGDEIGQMSVGDAYYEGEGVPKDHAEAMKWYRKSAERGNYDAYLQLGRICSKGDGVPRDYVHAYMWLTLLQDSEYHRRQALDLYKELYSNMAPKEIAKALKLAREWKPHDKN